MFLREIGQSPDQDIRGGRTEGWHPFASQTPHRDSFEQLAQLFLKDDHDHDQENRQKALKHPRGHLQVQISSDDVDGAQNHDAPNYKSSAGALSPYDGRVKQDRDKNDVDDLRNGDCREWIDNRAVAHGLSRFSLSVSRW